MIKDQNPPWQLPPLTMEEAKRLLEGPCGEEMHRITVSHMTYFVFGKKGPRGEPQNLRNGTCFFFKTPARLMAVTAKHVIEEFRRVKDRDPSTICQIGNLLVDPIERLIAVGLKADIATFDVTDHELRQIDKRPITLWPPEPPDGDDRGVIFAGYPAAAIVVDDAFTRGFGIYVATAGAQRVTDWQLSCTIEWENIIRPARGFGNLPPKNYDTGGMSGGPVLAIRERNGNSGRRHNTHITYRL
jgi:hypothetical protein